MSFMLCIFLILNIEFVLGVEGNAPNRRQSFSHLVNPSELKQLQSVQNCSEILAYKVTRALPEGFNSFMDTTAASESACAWLCYEKFRDCRSALYFPRSRLCRFSVQNYPCLPPSAIDGPSPYRSGIVMVHCSSCHSKKTTTKPLPFRRIIPVSSVNFDRGRSVWPHNASSRRNSTGFETSLSRDDNIDAVSGNIRRVKVDRFDPEYGQIQILPNFDLATQRVRENTERKPGSRQVGIDSKLNSNSIPDISTDRHFKTTIFDRQYSEGRSKNRNKSKTDISERREKLAILENQAAEIDPPIKKTNYKNDKIRNKSVAPLRETTISETSDVFQTPSRTNERNGFDSTTRFVAAQQFLLANKRNIRHQFQNDTITKRGFNKQRNQHSDRAIASFQEVPVPGQNVHTNDKTKTNQQNERHNDKLTTIESNKPSSRNHEEISVNCNHQNNFKLRCSQSDTSQVNTPNALSKIITSIKEKKALQLKHTPPLRNGEIYDDEKFPRLRKFRITNQSADRIASLTGNNKNVKFDAKLIVRRNKNKQKAAKHKYKTKAQPTRSKSQLKGTKTKKRPTSRLPRPSALSQLFSSYLANSNHRRSISKQRNAEKQVSTEAKLKIHKTKSNTKSKYNLDNDRNKNLKLSSTGQGESKVRGIGILEDLPHSAITSSNLDFKPVDVGRILKTISKSHSVVGPNKRPLKRRIYGSLEPPMTIVNIKTAGATTRGSSRSRTEKFKSCQPRSHQEQKPQTSDGKTSTDINLTKLKAYAKRKGNKTISEYLSYLKRKANEVVSSRRRSGHKLVRNKSQFTLLPRPQARRDAITSLISGGQLDVTHRTSKENLANSWNILNNTVSRRSQFSSRPVGRKDLATNESPIGLRSADNLQNISFKPESLDFSRREFLPDFLADFHIRTQIEPIIPDLNRYARDLLVERGLTHINTHAYLIDRYIEPESDKGDRILNNREVALVINFTSPHGVINSQSLLTNPQLASSVDNVNIGLRSRHQNPFNIQELYRPIQKDQGNRISNRGRDSAASAAGIRYSLNRDSYDGFRKSTGTELYSTYYKPNHVSGHFRKDDSRTISTNRRAIPFDTDANLPGYEGQHFYTRFSAPRRTYRYKSAGQELLSSPECRLLEDKLGIPLHLCQRELASKLNRLKRLGKGSRLRRRPVRPHFIQTKRRDRETNEHNYFAPADSDTQEDKRKYKTTGLDKDSKLIFVERLIDGRDITNLGTNNEPDNPSYLPVSKQTLSMSIDPEMKETTITRAVGNLVNNELDVKQTWIKRLQKDNTTSHITKETNFTISSQRNLNNTNHPSRVPAIAVKLQNHSYKGLQQNIRKRKPSRRKSDGRKRYIKGTVTHVGALRRNTSGLHVKGSIRKPVKTNLKNKTETKWLKKTFTVNPENIRLGDANSRKSTGQTSNRDNVTADASSNVKNRTDDNLQGTHNWRQVKHINVSKEKVSDKYKYIIEGSSKTTIARTSSEPTSNQSVETFGHSKITNKPLKFIAGRNSVMGDDGIMIVSLGENAMGRGSTFQATDNGNRTGEFGNKSKLAAIKDDGLANKSKQYPTIFNRSGLRLSATERPLEIHDLTPLDKEFIARIQLAAKQNNIINPTLKHIKTKTTTDKPSKNNIKHKKVTRKRQRAYRKQRKGLSTKSITVDGIRKLKSTNLQYDPALVATKSTPHLRRLYRVAAGQVVDRFSGTKTHNKWDIINQPALLKVSLLIGPSDYLRPPSVKQDNAKCSEMLLLPCSHHVGHHCVTVRLKNGCSVCQCPKEGLSRNCLGSLYIDKLSRDSLLKREILCPDGRYAQSVIRWHRKISNGVIQDTCVASTHPYCRKIDEVFNKMPRTRNECMHYCMS